MGKTIGIKGTREQWLSLPLEADLGKWHNIHDTDGCSEDDGKGN